jgi:hypothetical protein
MVRWLPLPELLRGDALILAAETPSSACVRNVPIKLALVVNSTS